MGQGNPNHQLRTVVYPIFKRVSTILLVVQDFATIHRAVGPNAFAAGFPMEIFAPPQKKKHDDATQPTRCQHEISKLLLFPLPIFLSLSAVLEVQLQKETAETADHGELGNR